MSTATPFGTARRPGWASKVHPYACPTNRHPPDATPCSISLSGSSHPALHRLCPRTSVPGGPSGIAPLCDADIALLRWAQAAPLGEAESLLHPTPTGSKPSASASSADADASNSTHAQGDPAAAAAVAVPEVPAAAKEGPPSKVKPAENEHSPVQKPSPEANERSPAQAPPDAKQRFPAKELTEAKEVPRPRSKRAAQEQQSAEPAATVKGDGADGE